METWSSWIFFAEGKHLVIDAAVTTVYRNIAFPHVASIPCYAAKQTEDRKFCADMTSTHPIVDVHGGHHVLVPFGVEDGGHFGAHALTLLRALATVALEKGRRPSNAYRFYTPLVATMASL